MSYVLKQAHRWQCAIAAALLALDDYILHMLGTDVTLVRHA